MKHICVSILFLLVFAAAPLPKAQSGQVLVEGVVGDYAPTAGIYMLHDVSAVSLEDVMRKTGDVDCVRVFVGEEAVVQTQGGGKLGGEDIAGGMAVRVAGSLLGETIRARLVIVLQR